MAQIVGESKPEADRRSRRRRTPPSPGLGFLSRLALIASFAILAASNLPRTIVRAEPHSTIPRSNNRYTNYNGIDSSLDTLSSPLNRESYHPPWNPSPKIDADGFLSDHYLRAPGEWEGVANIRGRHGPRNRGRYTKLLAVPVRIRQVPGDGNCLFHSIAACLHHAANGTHLPMDTHECFRELRGRSLGLRNAAVDVLQNEANGGRRRLFLQGEEYLEAQELLRAAAAQFDLDGGEYCELMRKESYWGGGPEIVALCNHLQRPIHIYELIPSEEVSNPPPSKSSSTCDDVETSNQFTLRRMACFGSPKFDRREPLHILSADSRFPDVEPRRIRKVGNHFLALFPVTSANGIVGREEGNVRFRRHALIRGGSRAEGGRGATRSRSGDGSRAGNELGTGNEISRRTDKWDGGRGRWTRDVMDWFVGGEDGMYYLEERKRRKIGSSWRVLLGDIYWGLLGGFL